MTWCKLRISLINAIEPLIHPARTWNSDTFPFSTYFTKLTSWLSLLKYYWLTDISSLTSLWPPIYFVAECKTRSAPRARAFWFRGVAKVPSTQTNAPLLWQSLETSSMSTHRRNGLVGDSVKNRETCMRENVSQLQSSDMILPNYTSNVQK